MYLRCRGYRQCYLLLFALRYTVIDPYLIKMASLYLCVTDLGGVIG